MVRFGSAATTLATAIAALLIVSLPSAAQQQQQFEATPQLSKRPIAVKPAAKTAVKPAAKTAVRTAAAKPADKTADKTADEAADIKPHRLVLQVNTNEPAVMNLALNNAANVAQYYKDLGENVSIEVVTFGPGLHMLRDDTSPVKARIASMATSTPSISFKACGNTKANMSKAEEKDIPLITEASLVKSGVVRVMELQEQGWTYVKP
jgi:intracellular sulfur oxidation DsrE/DsrF family protein